MRITIQRARNGSTEHETDQELQRAFNVLHQAFIQTRGGGRFADASVAVILELETDTPAALAVLTHAGIRAFAS